MGLDKGRGSKPRSRLREHEDKNPAGDNGVPEGGRDLKPDMIALLQETRGQLANKQLEITSLRQRLAEAETQFHRIEGGIMTLSQILGDEGSETQPAAPNKDRKTK